MHTVAPAQHPIPDALWAELATVSHLDAWQPRALGSSTPSAPRPQRSPGRASLATGRYPHSHGVMGLSHGGFDGDLPSQERHTAARPAVCGYETHLFGLQHVTQNAVDGGDVEDALLEGPIAAPRYRLALQGRPSTPRGSVGATG